MTGGTMTKAARIRTLYVLRISVRNIAKLVGCSPEYVRVCARQRLEGKPSHADINYMKGLGCSTSFELHMLFAARKYGIDDMHAAYARHQRELRVRRYREYRRQKKLAATSP